MLSSKPCYRCAEHFAGTHVNVPGPSFGHLVVDMPCCPGCADKHDVHMEDKFWMGAADSGTNNCQKCGTGLTSRTSRPVYRKANSGSAPLIVHVCNSCHAEYRGHCQSAAQKKGE